MYILSRYIFKTIVATTLIVFTALLGMDFFIELVNEFGDVGKGTYGLWQAIQHVLWSMPRDIYRLFPMVGLIGALMGLGSLASHSELIVMRASTMSVAQISRAVLYAIIFLVMLATILGEVIAPPALYHADTEKLAHKSAGRAVATQLGIWIREGNDFIHINDVPTKKTLQNVQRYEFDDNQYLLRTSFAKRGDYIDGVWQMSDVVHSYLSNIRVSAEKVAKETWPITLNPDVLQVTQVEPEEMSLAKLHRVIEYRKLNNIDSAEYRLSFWQRLFQPIAKCIMILLAIPFIFGPLRSATMGLRLLAGVMMGFAFYLLNQFFGPFALVYQFPPFLAAAMPTIIFLMVGYLLMTRVR